ncbi:peptidyl-prolyl cis-trans isomerase [Luteimonas pelagia]
MLQKLRDKSSSWIAKVILVLLAVPFAFFGMEQYMTQRVDTWVAKVEAPPSWWAGAPSWWPASMLWREEVIDVDDFNERLAQARQQAQAAQGEGFDPTAFDTPENRRRLLDTMIEDRVLKLASDVAGVAVGDRLVRETISGIPAFQVDGRFDPERYRLALAAQVPQRSPREFEQMVRDGLARTLVASDIAESAVVTNGQVDRLLALLGEQRDVAFATVTAPELDAARQQVDAAQLQAWYDANRGDFLAPETVAIEYLVLDPAAMAAMPAPDEAALRERYEQERSRFVDAEQRLARHILVTPDGDNEAAVEAARAEAAALAEQARAEGADFAAIAGEHSDDTGSRASGGELGWVERGTMGSDAFDDALFALSPGEVSAPVRTDFGWHVIRLEQVRGGDGASFEDVRETLAAEQAEADRARAFSEMAGKVVDEVYANPNSLAPAARVAGQTVAKAGPFARGGGEGIAALPEVQRAAFSEALIEDGTVSDPIELPDGRRVLLRVAAHTPQRERPLEDVRAEVVAAVRADRAAKAAQARADAILEAVRAGGSLAEAAGEGIEVAEVPGVPRGAPVPDAATSEAMFALAPPAAGEVAAGSLARDDGSVVVFVVRGVTPGDPAAATPEQREGLRAQLAEIHGMADAQAFTDALRKRMSVSIAEERL